ncbi:helix-turn-helix domain-containing protein [Desulfovibrio sp. JC010]|uniref:helix-turn-helix domain-containing protein n=1 Tax=Desulfovibrio sp. JC010 TaxID=2593641 RepID=UPI0013D8C5C0|nr:helix-turn-helix transcriptional regulator [Desulfovibrio sp. JC010]NDV25931.1 helix-turn-helix transcriptional regulator [Desulfovibrio sp. JC010]
MLELTRRSTTKDSVDFCIKVPASQAAKFIEASKSFWALAGLDVQEFNDEGEEIVTVDEAFPDVTPGDLLRGARFREDMTQAQLSAATGIHKNNISEMERGVRNITIEMAKKLGEALNVSYKHFL